MITAFNHTSFTVSDLDLAVAFWTETLGFEAAAIAERSAGWVACVTGVEGARIRVAHLTGYGHHMEFIEYRDAPKGAASASPNRPGTAHVCLEIADIRDTFERLIAAGARPLGEIARISDPAMRPCSAVYIRDPNGIIVELLEL